MSGFLETRVIVKVSFRVRLSRSAFLRDVVVSRSNAFCLSNVERASLSIARVSFCLSVVRLPVVPAVGVVFSLLYYGFEGKKNREKKKCVFVE